MSRMLEIDDFVESKVDEISEILDDYDVFDHDAEAIIEIVRELGRLLQEAVDENKRLCQES